MSFDYDIAVVGAGPAGSTFARLIGPAYRVVVLDAQSMKNAAAHKPCGGLLAPDAQKALARFELTLPKEVLVDPQIFAVKTLDLKSGLVRHYPRSYLNLDRYKFDSWLVSLIPAEEVCVVRGCCRDIVKTAQGFKLSYRTEDGETKETTARFVVGADGANSTVRRRFFKAAKLRPYTAIQQWFSSRHPTSFYSCVFDPETSDSCSWSICKDGHFIFGGAFPGKDCRARFERQKEKLASWGFPFSEPVRTEACLVMQPRSPRSFCCGGGGVFLIGEAAGFISRSSFEGISFAIDSAVILSGVFARGGRDLNLAYRRATRILRLRLFLKVLKSPFMYNPLLRYLVMKSGLRAIDIR